MDPVGAPCRVEIVCRQASDSVFLRAGRGLASHLLWLLSGHRSFMHSNPTKHPTLLRLAHNVTFVRVTVVVAWISSMAAMLSMLALILAGMRF